MITTTRFVEKASGLLASRFNRRGFFARSAIVGSAVAVNPVTYILKPTTAYAAVCSCYGSACDCGALCCDGYTEFCCTLTGQNKCPSGTMLGGWWKADGTAFCGGPRYYMDCNEACNGCGCGSNGICSGSCSGTGCGCANGDCNNRKSGCTMFRYGQCHQEMACLGPILCRIITCVPPWAIDGSCSSAVRVDQNTAGHDRPCLHNVVGTLDSVVEDGGIRVRGWAVDFDTQGPVTIQVFVDGNYAGVGVTDQSRPDVGAAYPGYGNQRGFDIKVGASGGLHNVCVYALNADYGSGSAQLGCQSIRLSNPFGSLDSVTTQPGALRVAGWLIDPDTTGSIKAHIYVDGAFKTEVIANLPRPDVAAAYPGQGTAHGFDTTFPISGGSHTVCVYGINVGAGTGNPLIACQTVEVGKPFGSFDTVAPTSGGIRIKGWAIDPDIAGPIKVAAFVDGHFVVDTLANTSRPDVGASYPSYGANHGFDLTVPAAAGSRQICVFAINNDGTTNNALLACRTVQVPSGNPFGAFDSISGGPSNARVTGWVIDPDSVGPIKVHLYVDGAFASEITADQIRTDVAAAYPGFGSTHGFDAIIPLSGGFRQVCAYAINVGPGSNPLIACRSVQVGGNPYGSVDSATGGAGSIHLTGWAIDPDTASPVDVHVYVDGVFATLATAATSRPDVGAAYPLYGATHGYDLSVSAAKGSRSVCVYAINTGVGSGNPLLACRTVTVV